jgi:hypothetical protein
MGSQLCIKRIYSKKRSHQPERYEVRFDVLLCKRAPARKIRERETSNRHGEVKDLTTQVPFDIYLRLRSSSKAAITANTNPKPVITNPMYSILPIYIYIIRNIMLHSNREPKKDLLVIAGESN